MLLLERVGDKATIRAAGAIACVRGREGDELGRGDRAAGVGCREGLGVMMKPRC